jgi:hypothetical protein
MKGDKGKKHCDKACGAFVFLAIVLMAVSQLLGEENEKYGTNPETIYCTSFSEGDGGCDGVPCTQACMELGTINDCLKPTSSTHHHYAYDGQPVGCQRGPFDDKYDQQLCRNCGDSGVICSGDGMCPSN